MAHDNTAARNAALRQNDLFRLAKARHALGFTVLETLTGIPEATMRGWAKGAAMPVWALPELGRAGVPDDLLSLVTGPEYAIVRQDGDDGDVDRLAVEAAGFVGDYIGAKADGVVTPMERRGLVERGRRVVAAGRRLAA